MKNCKSSLAHLVSFSGGRITSLSFPMNWFSVLYSFFVLVPHLLNFSLMYSLLVLQSSFLYLDLKVLSFYLTLSFLIALYFVSNDLTFLFMFFKSSDIHFCSGLKVIVLVFSGVCFSIILLSSVL